MTNMTALRSPERTRDHVRDAHEKDGISRVTPWLSRIVLLSVTLLFLAISVKYLGNPVRTAAGLRISLGSPAAVTTIRVGFGAFPFALGIFTLACLISTRRHLAGLYLVLSVIGAATAARILGIIVDGPAPQSLRLLKPELIFVTLSTVAIALELRRRREEAD